VSSRASTPPVTICIPTFNGEAYLRQSVESALQQDFEDFELLIVDDCSEDSSVNIAYDYARYDSRVRVYVNERNLGLGGNWNRCATLARGAWIKFLFQDDTLDPMCVKRMLAAARPGPLIVACARAVAIEETISPGEKQFYEYYAAEHSIPRRFPGESLISAEAFARHLVDHPIDNCIGEPTAVLIHRSAFQRFGGFRRDLVQVVDWEFEARIAVQAGLCYLSEPLATFRVHGRSATATSRATATRRFQRDFVDPLLVFYEIVHSKWYEPVRIAAKERRPPVDLSSRLLKAVDVAERSAAECQAETVWSGVKERYPWLMSAPPGRRLKRWARTKTPTCLLSVARWATRPR